MTCLSGGITSFGTKSGSNVERCEFLTVGPKCESALAPVAAYQHLIRSSWPVVTRFLPLSVHTIPLQGPVWAFPRPLGRACFPKPSSPATPIESSMSSTPKLPALRRTSQSRALPSDPPLARMCSSLGLQATVRTLPEWPASECVVAPDRRSTSLTAGC